MSLRHLWAFLAVALPVLAALIASLPATDLTYHLRAGEVILEKQAQVPAGEFRCNYYSYEELIAAGLDPDPTTGATPPFLVVVGSERVGTNRTTNIGAAESITVGAVQSIDVATGKIELHQSFKSFQIISAGRN